ncbi:MAG TPA: PAS domain S-box protein, partial [Bacteroidota bacterium]|nr:PAS domain S-box protein [Bacteroidota bacterium]
MNRFFGKIRKYNRAFGLVEQSQIVASTAVVVAMVTIISAHFVLRQEFGLLDFISVITVGTIGFVSVIFSLKYGRQLEEQKRELQSLNNIAEAVNHSVELNYVMQSALSKVMESMGAECGWIYLVENDRLQMHRQAGTQARFFPRDTSLAGDYYSWVRDLLLQNANAEHIERTTTPEFKALGIQTISSIPLERQGEFAGVLIAGSKESRKSDAKRLALMQAFGNQINMALQNASLFEQVKQSEQLYADLYEHSPDMYHSIDPNGVIMRCNYTESLVLGFSKEELIGKPVLRIYPQSQHEKVRENLRKIFEEGGELRGAEEQIQRRDGSILQVSVNTSTVRDSLGRPTFARVVLRDITEQKKYEAQILQSQKIDSIGNLAGGIAHDFNNILTSILGSASIMRRRMKDDDRWTKYVSLIETASRRGASLTRQLLTFARKDNPHVRLIDLNNVIDETIRLIEATTPKSITIKVTLATEQAIVEADEGQMQQAILNLCLNARDAMPNGGVLYVSSKCVHVDGPSMLQSHDA